MAILHHGLYNFTVFSCSCFVVHFFLFHLCFLLVLDTKQVMESWSFVEKKKLSNKTSPKSSNPQALTKPEIHKKICPNSEENHNVGTTVHE